MDGSGAGQAGGESDDGDAGDERTNVARHDNTPLQDGVSRAASTGTQGPIKGKGEPFRDFRDAGSGAELQELTGAEALS
jgi:hypothetical protein